MKTARDVLNELKWGDGFGNLDDVVVFYLHRGAQDDIRSVGGAEIDSLGHSSMEIGDTSIPYHRIRKITLRGKTVFEREEKHTED
ncbi:MAG: DUF504 domain-containing protein [Thermoplasmata archaeon HGW-Thermoplasmata-1]|nr:MAG: DUF504 domain-containing protein [Thermoplasmata archaeon HGW-Thermoplasmata-1]